jgi:hypothetical protein
MFGWKQWLNSESLLVPWEGPVLPFEEDLLLVQSSFSWISEGPFYNLVKFTPDFIEPLIEEPELPVNEPLLGLLDQGFDYTTLFKALWETRFLAREDPRMAPHLVSALREWLRGGPLTRTSQGILQRAKIGRPPDGPFQKLDHLFFLLTLAQQQGFVQHSVFAVIGLNKLLEFGPNFQKERFSELYDLYLMVKRWQRFGGSLKLIYEFSHTPDFLRALHEHCPRLEDLLRCNSKK